MRPFNAVFLDAQGTLIQPRASTAAFYAEACRSCGGTAGMAEIVPILRQLWIEAKRSADGQIRFDTSEELTRSWWGLYNGRVFDRLGMKDGRERFVQLLWESFGCTDRWRTFPEVEPVLAELRRRGYRLGIVSNWDSRLVPICHALGITGYMEFVLASSVVGVEKPDRRIFEMALARMGVEPDRAIHVGDDFEADVLGARGAGIAAVHLNRDGAGSSDGPAIGSLEGLLEMLPCDQPEAGSSSSPCSAVGRSPVDCSPGG